MPFEKDDLVKDLLILAEQQARLVLMGMRKPIVPTWVIISKDCDPIIHATPWKNELEKSLASVVIKKLLRKHDAIAYSFLSECWGASAPKDWDPETALPEKDHPMNRADRREAVIAFATDGKKPQWRIWIIRRDWNEQVRDLDPEPLQDMSFPESWLSELLSK